MAHPKCLTRNALPTRSDEREACELRTEKKKSASLLCISSEREMQLKNRSHVATQTSLEEASKRDEQQVYESTETGHSDNLATNDRGEEPATMERQMMAELDTADIEIIDNDESVKED